jgi:uncharacterized membrane protein YphA (DoxX/SURF4 family)
MTLVALVLRVAVGMVLLRAAMAKLAGSVDLPSAVANYGLLPANLHRPVARTLPWAELVLSGALLVGILPRPAAAAGAAVLATFAAAMAVNLVRGRRFPCGCSSGDDEISWTHVAGNCALAASAVLVAAEPRVALSLYHPGQLSATGLSDGAAIALLLATGAAAALVALGVASMANLRAYHRTERGRTT